MCSFAARGGEKSYPLFVTVICVSGAVFFEVHLDRSQGQATWHERTLRGPVLGGTGHYRFAMHNAVNPILMAPLTL
jgi:hypothetical protein